MSDSESTTTWVSVAEAAEKAQVDSGTVRQWYRSGRIPTRRSEGERGAFLVPLDLVLELVEPALDVTAPTATSIDEVLREGNADRLAVENEAIKQDLEEARSELAEAREQLGFLRSQLAEAADEGRSLKEELRAALDDRKGVETRLATVEAELTQLRRTAARSSITDNSWLDQQTPAYQSPVRRQAMATPDEAPSKAALPQDGPTASFADARSSELSDLLAATRPDDEDEATEGDAADESALEEYTPARAVWTDEVPHPPLGEHDDDLLPEPDKKSRFGKK